MQIRQFCLRYLLFSGGLGLSPVSTSNAYRYILSGRVQRTGATTLAITLCKGTGVLLAVSMQYQSPLAKCREEMGVSDKCCSLIKNSQPYLGHAVVRQAQTHDWIHIVVAMSEFGSVCTK